MNTDTLSKLIETSDISTIQKNILTGFVARSKKDEEDRREARKLIEEVSRDKMIDEIIVSTNEVKIYTILGKDEWSVKYPFRSILFKDGKWQRCSTVSPNLDMALLIYLEYKYLSQGSGFTGFAMKMLEIRFED